MEHNRAQLGAQMEENETLRTAIDALQTPAKLNVKACGATLMGSNTTQICGNVKGINCACFMGSTYELVQP